MAPNRFFPISCGGKQKSCFHPTQCSIVGQNPMKCAIIIYYYTSRYQNLKLLIILMWLTIFSDLLGSIVSYYSIEAHCVVYSQQSTHIRMYQEQINMIFYFINQEYLSKHFMIKMMYCLTPHLHQIQSTIRNILIQIGTY